MIEKEQILLLTQGGLNVFSHFLGFEVNLHRNFRSPFYDDRRASCHIYYDRKTSSYKFYDHGDTTYSGGLLLVCGKPSVNLEPENKFSRSIGNDCTRTWIVFFM